jgi:hypothetical protein
LIREECSCPDRFAHETVPAHALAETFLGNLFQNPGRILVSKTFELFNQIDMGSNCVLQRVSVDAYNDGRRLAQYPQAACIDEGEGGGRGQGQT